ncbi:MAG: FHA domain-containing protein, partial [Deltaproteobacteria bacterium]|nr:FHA domain-containing protein [Deltaproteobacteria bacterium]
DCDLVLPDTGVAEEHLVIQSTPLGFRAEARARVIFNGAPADTRVLSHADELTLGSTIVRFAVNARDGIGADTGMSSITMAAASPLKNAVGELIFISGSAKGDRIPLGDDQIILGTRVDCSTVLSDLLASPLHCAISKAGDQFVATDLGSESGTFINGERIFQGTALRPGDLIAIGAHVLECRLLGGVTIASRGNTIFTTLSPVGGVEGPQPRFVLDGRVIKAKKIILGRAPSCDVIVDGPAVSREHCTITWDNGFVVRDTSAAGTYVDDKRVVQQQLPPSGVLRIVDSMYRLTVRGEVCTLEYADGDLAQAAVDVQRAKAGAHMSMLSRAMSVSDVRRAAAPMAGSRADVGGGGGGEGMKTLFRMDAGALEQEIASRKKDLKRNAPAWRASSDLSRDGALRGAVVLSVLAALALCGGAVFLGNGKALMNHPLSNAHSSAAFVEQAGGATVCGACHTAGMQVNIASCASCHEGFAARPKHEALDCGGCHVEHRGESKDKSLHALETCTESCHKNQHKNDFAPQANLPQKLAAGPIPEKPALIPSMNRTPETKALAVVGLHDAHGQRGVNCTACHANINGTEYVEGKPSLSCFRCHQGGEQALESGCGKCHGQEHDKAMARLAPGSPGLQQKMGTPSPLAAVGWATGLAFVAGAPGLLFGTWVRIRRRRAQRLIVEEMKSHPAEVIKRLVHSINDNKCVGCNMCVQACPASVLELVEHKSRVVNFDSCIQCKKCEQACAFDALRMHDADKPPPMIPMASIDAFHETPVAGMFLIGQASGTPQVKNATNLGRAAVQRILQQGYRPGAGQQLGCQVDIVIVGSGPA